MKRLKYLIKRILRMDYGAMLRVVGQIHRKTGKNRLWLFVDMVRCGTKYGAGYSDYRLCEFYNLTPEQRATYVTRGVNNAIVAKLNSRDSYPQVEDKTEFNTLFAEFLGRGWLNMSTADEESIKAPTTSIHSVMDNIIAEGMAMIGTPADKMNKDAKIKLLAFLDDRGVFLIQKSGQKVCELLGISKFTLYNYLEEVRKGK